MKILFVILLTVLFIGCKPSAQQTKGKIIALLRIKVDSSLAAMGPADVVSDSINLLFLESITTKQRIEVAIDEIRKEVSSIRDNDDIINKRLPDEMQASERHKNDTTASGSYFVESYRSDSTSLKRDATRLPAANKTLDSLKLLAKNSNFWGYRAVAKIYLHNTKNGTPLNVDRSIFINKDLQIDRY